MAPQITAGKLIPETDAERVAVALRAFEHKAQEFTADISGAIQNHKTGWVRMHVMVSGGRLCKAQIQTDFSEDLDKA